MMMMLKREKVLKVGRGAEVDDEVCIKRFALKCRKSKMMVFS